MKSSSKASSGARAPVPAEPNLSAKFRQGYTNVSNSNSNSNEFDAPHQDNEVLSSRKNDLNTTPRASTIGRIIAETPGAAAHFASQRVADVHESFMTSELARGLRARGVNELADKRDLQLTAEIETHSAPQPARLDRNSRDS